MKTINIKGKEYVPVNERIKAFRAKYPEWTITTELVQFTEDYCVIKASIIDETGRVRATGFAHEERNASNINKTSFVENCDTSAIGRAIGIFGIGIDASVASADEVQNAVERQAVASKKIDKAAIASLKMLCESKGRDFGSLLSYYDCEKAEDLTYEDWLNASRLLSK